MILCEDRFRKSFYLGKSTIEKNRVVPGRSPKAPSYSSITLTMEGKPAQAYVCTRHINALGGNNLSRTLVEWRGCPETL